MRRLICKIFGHRFKPCSYIINPNIVGYCKRCGYRAYIGVELTATKIGAAYLLDWRRD